MKHILAIADEFFPAKRPMLTEFFNKELTFNSISLSWIYRTSDPQLNNKRIMWNNSEVLLYYYKFTFFKSITNFLITIKMALESFRKKKYDAIIAHDKVNSAFISFLLSRFLRVKLIFVWNGPMLDFYRSDLDSSIGLIYYLKKVRYFFSQLIYDLVLEKSLFIHPISDEMMVEYIPRKFHYKCHSISERASNIFLNSSSTEKIPNSLVYHGTFGRIRNLEFLVEILAKLKSRKIVCKLFLIGWEDTEGDIKRLKSKAKLLNVDNQMIFLGPYPVSFLPRILSFMSIGLSPIPPKKMFKIATPTKTMEYLSLGIPVVGNSEIIVQNRILKASGGGFSVSYDASDFAEKVEILLKSKRISNQMSQSGKSWILDNWTFATLAKEVSKLYLLRL